MTTKFYGYAFIILVLYAFVSHMDYKDETQQEADYCSMVSLWKADALKKIPQRARAGWPPFKPEISCN
jgi:hypothetical protein